MISWDLYKALCVKLCSSCSSMEFVYLDAQFYRNRAIKKNTLKNWCVSIICSCSTVADFINMYYNNKNTFINNQGTDIGECCGGVGKELQSLLSKAQIVEVLLFAFTSKVKTKQNRTTAVESHGPENQNTGQKKHTEKSSLEIWLYLLLQLFWNDEIKEKQ